MKNFLTILLAGLICSIFANFSRANLADEIKFRYEQGDVTNQQIIDKIKDLTPAASQGDAKSQLEIGLNYRLLEQWDLSIRWLTKAAEQDHSLALYLLGNFYYLGEGVPEDRALAKRLWERAAALGNPESLYALGSLYITGESANKDVKHGIELLEKAFQSNYFLAYNRVGLAYLMEDEIKDTTKAFYYFCEGANKGEGNSQSIIGHFYYGIIKSDFIKRNTETALYWYLHSADQVKPVSLKLVSDYYFEGIYPISKDIIRGTVWLTIAYNHKQIDLKPRLNQIVGGFNSKQQERYQEEFHKIASTIDDKNSDYRALVDIEIPVSDCRNDYPKDLYSRMSMEAEIEQ